MSKCRKRSSVGAGILLLGAALTITAGETKAQTVLTNNDGIIRNSLCVGFDCPNSINFGFDTIRMMENNTRISFFDTSSASGFPTRDWHLTANSHQSGGLSYFGIRDCGNTSNGEAECGTRVFAVQAGARADAIFATGNRVGFGTSSPVLELHTRDGDSPALRLEQDGSSGFTPQTWDIAGNETNFFIRDATNGSQLPFRIRPGAPSNSIHIVASGNVGFGTASPQSKLHVASGALRFSGTGAFGAGADAGIFSPAGNDLSLITNGNTSMSIDTAGNVSIPALPNCSAGIVTNGSGTLACSTSSIRFKTIVGELAPGVALENVMALRPRVGAYKETPGVPEHWFIAEEVAEVDPALVGLHGGKPYTVKTQNIVADLVAVIQEQQRRMGAQQRRMDAQERRIEVLEKAVTR